MKKRWLILVGIVILITIVTFLLLRQFKYSRLNAQIPALAATIQPDGNKALVTTKPLTGFAYDTEKG
ncbi:MAG: hypothetical protein ACOY81_11065, partial [Bacillota bacterium]